MKKKLLSDFGNSYEGDRDRKSKNIHGVFSLELAEVWAKNIRIEFRVDLRSLASKNCLPRNSRNYAEDKFSRLAISDRSETQI